jgi:GNAT superfamily N-acetyltransferase
MRQLDNRNGGSIIGIDEQIIQPLPNKKIKARCITCNRVIEIGLYNYLKRRKIGPWSCYDCIRPQLIIQSKGNPLYKDVSYRDKFRKLHLDQKYYARVHNKTVYQKISDKHKQLWIKNRTQYLLNRNTPEFRNRVSKQFKKLWQDSTYRDHQVELRRSVNYHIKASNLTKELWQNSVYRSKILSHWNNPEYRQKLIAILDKYRPMTVISPERVSKLQRALYLILDDLGVQYHKEGEQTVIQFRNRKDRLRSFIFDCLVYIGSKKLYIECHGDYFHMQKHKISLDISKAAFLKKHHNVDLLVLWESEFKNYDMVRDIIKRRLGLSSHEMRFFQFSDIKIEANTNINELKIFFGRYHYLANMGRMNSLSISGRLGDELIISALFNNPIRNEAATRLGFKQNQVLELTRFCIHPQYQKKNFASWFLAKAVNLARQKKQETQRFLAYSDISQGHLGTIYKAAGWKLDGKVEPDYWYKDKKNNLMIHKKSVWNRAKKHNQSESEYAKLNELVKVYDLGKYRYIL